MIREFRYPDEVEEVVSLWTECGLLNYNETTIIRDEIRAKQSRDPELFLIYEIDGEIVGTVIGGWDGWRGWIYKLAVSSKFRKKGIGTELVKEISGRLVKLGARRIGAFAVSDNNASISLFKKNGFITLDVAMLRLRV